MTLTPNLFSNLSHAFLGILFYVVLPEPENGPSVTSKLSGYSSVSSHVSLYLVPPELLCKPLDEDINSGVFIQWIAHWRAGAAKAV